MIVIGVISAKIDGWDTSPNTQYHIQTDEGPERYFRYQTISGQYRKEKRLRDGTVIGSYGWVDADGYLRLNDYVADNEGYRILRTKRLFVGSQTPISTALQSSSKYVGVRPVQSVTDVSSPTFKDALPYPEDKSKYLVFPSSTVSSLTIFNKKKPTPPIGYYPTSTPPAVALTDSTEEAEVAITPPYFFKSSFPSNKYTYKGSSYTAVIKAQPPNYNQNSVNPGNGFKYYLPKQYHKEESNSDNERVGSFGYIDPLGIRRVIYYNASPNTGFVHRKNNRYVGFEATPFDPTP
ncbi:hypothetical protein PGB90_008554 [Kerria lacca]